MTITLIGYVLGRSSVGLHTRTIGTIVVLVATPSLIFYTLVSMRVGLDTLGEMAIVALLVMLVTAVAGSLALATTGASQNAFLPSIVFPNSGNLGLALVLLTFGDEGLKLGMSYFFVVSLVQHSVGFSFAVGAVDLHYLARQPLLYAVALVLLVATLELEVPQMVLTTTQMLGGMMIPAMLILLGSSLATLTVSDLKPAIGVALARILIGIASALLVIWVLDLSGVVAGTVFLLATMPAAVFNYIYADRFGPHGATISGAVMVSTLLTFLILPGLIWYALRIANSV